MRHRVAFDEVGTGTLARQVRTEEVVADAYRDAGRPWPDARRDAGWNEYDATGVLGKHDDRLTALRMPRKRLAEAPEENRHFQRLLEATMLLWMAGDLASDGFEPFPAFRERVTAAMERLMAGPAGRRVAVFTSGGRIGFTVHLATKAPARTFLDVNWRVRNFRSRSFFSIAIG